MKYFDMLFLHVNNYLKAISLQNFEVKIVFIYYEPLDS